MKRVISIILVLCLLIPVGAISVFADDGSSWELTEFVDDFGDPTGEAYLRSIVSGTFSNTATPEENMRVILAYSPDRAVFTFRLVEYNDTLKIKATYTDSDSKTIKIKIDDEITEGTLTGTAPNGDLLLTGGLCLVKIYNAFLNGQDVRFIVEIGSSKYSFSADGKGFVDCLNDYFEASPNKTNILFYSGTGFIKLEYLLNTRPEYLYDDNYELELLCDTNSAGDVATSYKYDIYYSPSVAYADEVMDPGINFRSYYRDNYEKIETTYEELIETITTAGFSTQDVNLWEGASGTITGYVDADGNMLFIESSRNADNSDIDYIKSDECLIRIFYA